MSDSIALSDEVFARTKAAHERAESRPFIKDLMAGSSSVRSYVAYLSALAPVYCELEHQLRSVNEEASISLFDHRRLDRYDRIRSDLHAFGQNPDRLVTGRASHEYVRAIKAAAESPQRLIAHHYTRYLGDLAGGQAISRCMSKRYDVPESFLSFYDFSDLGDVVHYRRRYKSLLDLVPWSVAEKQEFINEVARVFDWNAALFDDLSNNSAGSGAFQASFLNNEKIHSPR